jgi:ATP-dependent RNA helicase DDX54/DBP10
MALLLTLVSLTATQFAEQHLTVSGGSDARGAADFDQGNMDAAILDLVPDDEAGISKKRATYHWDKKKKKYIRLQPGEALTGSGKVKSESGAKVNAGQQKGLYKKWQARTHMKVATAGEEGEDRPQGDGLPPSGLDVGH